MTAITDFGIIGLALASFSLGVIVGCSFAIGMMRVVVRALMWAVSDHREIQ